LRESSDILDQNIGELPDILVQNMKILFVGFNPGLRSGSIGHHYAGHSNRFWKLLADAQLTPRRYRPEEDVELARLGFGLTNIVARVTQTAAEITPEEYESGRRRLRTLIGLYSPRIAAFNGIGVYSQYADRRKVAAGIQESPVVPGVIDFVLPSPSGLVRLPYSEMLGLYKKLKALSDSLPSA
jgi:TDG/mug DNA glycosylase family protein